MNRNTEVMDRIREVAIYPYQKKDACSSMSRVPEGMLKGIWIGIFN